MVTSSHIYRASLGWKLFAILGGGLAVVGGALGMWYFGTGHEMKSAREMFIFVLLCLSFVLLGSYLVVSLLTFRIVLRSDSFAMTSFLSAKSIGRGDIAGFRLFPTKNVSTLLLVPKSPTGKKLKIPLFVSLDKAFYDWLETIPNLDAEDRARAEAQLAAETDLGFTPEQRSQRLVAARATAKALNWISIAVVLWGRFYPYPRALVVIALTALPLIVILLLVRSAGAFEMEGRRSDPRPNLVLPFILPGLILMLLALQGPSPASWKPLLIEALLGGGLLTAVVARADRSVRERPGPLMVLFIFGAVYAYGAIRQVNALF